MVRTTVGTVRYFGSGLRDSPNDGSMPALGRNQKLALVIGVGFVAVHLTALISWSEELKVLLG